MHPHWVEPKTLYICGKCPQQNMQLSNVHSTVLKHVLVATVHLSNMYSWKHAHKDMYLWNQGSTKKVVRWCGVGVEQLSFCLKGQNLINTGDRRVTSTHEDFYGSAQPYTVLYSGSYPGQPTKILDRPCLKQRIVKQDPLDNSRQS